MRKQHMVLMSVTEHLSCTSKLGLDFAGKIKRVLSFPCKSLLLFSCLQCWQLAGFLAATQQYCSSEPAEIFSHCIVLRPKKKKKKERLFLGFSLILWAHLHPVVWQRGRGAGRGCLCRPLCTFLGLCCWKDAKLEEKQIGV